jgi:hypothetical protein
VLGALTLTTLYATPPAPVAIRLTPTAAVAGANWLDRLNQWRTSTGVTRLSENTTWSAGDYNHAVYMVKNNLVTHYETPGVPYYTTAGDTAARNGNIQVSSTTSTTDQQVIDWWMAAPFHAMGMMDPRLTTTGFGSYREVKSGWQEGATLDTIRGNPFSGGAYPVYFPGNGTTEPLTTYGGGEFPDPLQACPGYAAPTGLPVFIQIGGTVNTRVGAHSFTGNGTALSHCAIDSSNAAVGSYLYRRGAVVLVPQRPLQTGVKYAVSLTVNGTPYTWSFTVGSFVVCTSVTTSVTPPSPSAPGTAITFSASAAGCPDPLFQFWILPPGATTWQVAQPYSTAASFTWGTVGLTTGRYLYSVWARNTSSPGATCSSLGCNDAYQPGATYFLGAPCTSVTDTPSPSPPQLAGTRVTFSAASTRCPNPLYQFWILPPGSTTWQVVQPYSVASIFTWNTTGLAPGLYLYTAWAKDANSPGQNCGSLGCNDAYMSAPAYDLTRQTCTSVTDAAAPPSPQISGSTVTFTATSTSCPHPLYQFWLLPPGTSTWKILQAYSTATTYAWNTSGLAAGSYLYAAWARDASSTGVNCSYLGCNDAFTTAPAYTLTSQPCTSITATASPASTAVHGAVVTFTATSSGCPNPLYQFWIQRPGSTEWHVVQSYSSAASFSWDTVALAAGTYRYSVWVRDASSLGANCSQLGCEDVYFPGTAYVLT